MRTALYNGLKTGLTRLAQGATVAGIAGGTALTGAYIGRQHLWRHMLQLPSPPLYHVKAQRRLGIITRDAVRLATDHYAPQTAQDLPTILIRTPYGRNYRAGIFGWLLSWVAQRFAERGYHVLVQDTRGRFDSEGIFTPYYHERNDGQDTLRWLRRQPWFNGQLALWGPSYLGIVQWIIADAPEVRAMMPIFTTTNLYQVIYPDDALDLSLALRWLSIFDELDRSHANYHLPDLAMLQLVELKVQSVITNLPLADLDQQLLGRSVPFYQHWLENPPPQSQLEQDLQNFTDIDQVQAAVHLVGGWYDFFLRGQLQDYYTLRAAGKNPYLTIGNWNHFQNGFGLIDGLHLGLDWFDTHLKQKPAPQVSPVRVFVMGHDSWRTMPQFPPTHTPTPYYLQPNGSLARIPSPDEQASSTYRYDPQDPTPILGGAQLRLIPTIVDNRPLETRADVLSFTTPPLEAPLEIMGPVRLQLYVASSLEHTDFFGRLCDVHPDGRSLNLCDGLFRIRPDKLSPSAEGIYDIEIDLWATAHCFLRGHHIRILVASGAHPRWSRNLGTGNPQGTQMKIAQQTVYHNRQFASALVLPRVT